MTWDILNLNEDDGWVHKQILYRLWDKNIECVFADIWYDDNIAMLIGCFVSNQKVLADALNIHPECVYIDSQHGLVILNLYQEKCLRKHYK